VRLVLTAAEVEELLRLGYEQRHFELKGAGRRDDTQFMAKVIRAALSLGNLRDGGHIVIGIDDKDPTSMLPGLAPDEAESWQAYDDVARKMAEYADPPLRFSLAELRLSSGAGVAVIEIAEFEDLPHICSRQLDKVLRKGALYVRSRTAPETVEVPSSVEMREILDLATEKALRSFVERLNHAGLTVTPAAGPTHPGVASAYETQRKDAWK
jgi:predicted HTH transcriptional regulator